jgi:hypothetical protein
MGQGSPPKKQLPCHFTVIQRLRPAPSSLAAFHVAPVAGEVLSNRQTQCVPAVKWRIWKSFLQTKYNDFENH